MNNMLIKYIKELIKINYSVDYITHTIQPGDSLNKIAKQYDIAVSSILIQNPSINPNYIYCGQRICIPVRKPFNIKLAEKYTSYPKVAEEITPIEEDESPTTPMEKEVTTPPKEEEVTPPKVREKRKIDVSGKWDTNWGEMILEQTGNNVTGTYEWDNGRISGILSGNLMTGSWSEAPTYSPPRDAGKVDITFEQDAFSGRWGYESEPLSGIWEGTRIY